MKMSWIERVSCRECHQSFTLFRSAMRSTYLVPSLFAASEPATPAATLARTTAMASATLKMNVTGRKPQKRLPLGFDCDGYVVYCGR